MSFLEYMSKSISRCSSGDISTNISRCISGDDSNGNSTCNSEGISGRILEDWMAEQKPLAKMIDFVPLKSLSSPGAPDSDLGRFQSEVER